MVGEEYLSLNRAFDINMMKIVYYCLLLFAVGTVVAFVIAFISFAQYSVTHVCVKSHKEQKKAYTSFIYSGKGLIPIHHPESDVLICDEYKEK